MIHVDVKKLGNLPDGGGWRYGGRQQGEENRVKTPGKPRNKHSDPLLGCAYVHTVIDGHSCVAYAKIHEEETPKLPQLCSFVLSSGSTSGASPSSGFCLAMGAPTAHIWGRTHAELEIKHKRTRPYRPQTNGKIERFHRALADGWACARCCPSEAERRGELHGWLHHDNHHRPHTACGRQPSFPRLINVSRQDA